MPEPIKALDTQTIEQDIKFIYEQGGTDDDVDNYLKENKVNYESTLASSDKKASDSIAALPPEVKKPGLLDVLGGGQTHEQWTEQGIKSIEEGRDFAGNVELATGALQKGGQALLTPLMHYANQRLLNIPRQLAEVAETEFAPESDVLGVETASKIAGVVGGAKTWGKIGTTIKPEDIAGVKAVKGALEGAAGTAIMAGVKNVVGAGKETAEGDAKGAAKEMAEFAVKLGIGAVAGGAGVPILYKGGDVLGKIVKAGGEFYRKNMAGYTKQFAETLAKQGSKRVFDPIRNTGVYISKVLVPHISKSISALLKSDAKKTKSIELLEYLKFNPEEIDDVLTLEPKYKNQLAEGASDSGYNIYKATEKKIEEAGAKIGEILSKAQMKNKTIKINDTINVFKKTLIDAGMIDQTGNPTRLAQESTDRMTQQLIQMWGTLDRLTTSPYLRFRQPVDIQTYRMIKTSLENMIKSNEAKNIPLYQIVKSLVKDIGKQVPGIKEANKTYHQLKTYESLWKKLYDRTSDVAIEKILNGLRGSVPNQGMARVVFAEQFNKIFGKGTMDDIYAWLAAQEHEETVGASRGIFRVLYNKQVQAREAMGSGGGLNKFMQDFSPETKEAASKLGKTIRGQKGSVGDIRDTVMNFKNTNKALEFGEKYKGKQDVIEQLSSLYEETKQKTQELKAQGKIDEAFANVNKGQLIREAMERAKGIIYKGDKPTKALGVAAVLTEKEKKEFSKPETGGDVSGDYMQFEQSTIDDLVKRGKVDKNASYDEKAKAYSDDLEITFGIPKEDQPLWNWRPSWYKKYNGDIEQIPETKTVKLRKSNGKIQVKKARDVMRQRQKALEKGAKK